MRKNTKTQEQFEKEVVEKSGGKIKPLGLYYNNNTKTKFLCNECGFVWDALPRTIICAGANCPECAKKIKNSKIKLTNEEFTERLHAVHPEVDPVGDYISSDTEMNFKCNVCGHEWVMTPHAVKRKQSGCIKCKNTKHIQKLFGENPKEFLYKNYVTEKKTIRQIAIEVYGNINCASTINMWLKRYDIPLRHGSEAIKTQWINNDERRELSRNIALDYLRTEETIKKARAAQSTPEFRKRASEIKKGENNPMYGVVGEKHHNWDPKRTHALRTKERKTLEYQRWLKAVHKRDGYSCQCCGDKKGGNFNVHHIESYGSTPSKRYDVDNGITLCEPCHKKFHSEYGWGNNTTEQFSSFMNKHKNHSISI